MRKTVLALVITVMATPAFAQVGMDQGIGAGSATGIGTSTGMGPNLMGESRKLKTDVEIKQEQEREAGYKSGLSKIPDAKVGKKDPWGGVRGASTPASGSSRASSK